MESRELAIRLARALDAKKAFNIHILEVEDLTTVTEYFVIATGTSSTHVKALADEVEFQLKERHSIATEHTEGYRSNSWILLDYGNVIVHVFTEESRAFYDLDRLWQDGETVDITEILKANEE